MTLFEYLLWWFFGIVPRRYGKVTKQGYFYNTYYNKETGKTVVIENKTGRVLTR